MTGDAHAIQLIAAISDGEAPHIISHYLYVPSSEAAKAIAEELRRRDFRVETGLGAGGANWLVLAHHEAVPTEELLASMRETMEELVADCGGEYDGWEAEVPYRPLH